MRRILACWGAAASLVLSLDASAVDYAEEFTRKIQAARTVAPLGADLFGDSTDWYSGTTTFRVVDVEIPGNNALPVRIARVRSTAPPEGPTAPGLMGDWELELPYLSGVFPQGNGWRIGPSLTVNRCSSGPLTPPAVSHGGGGAFGPEEYWRGYFVSIPSQGSTQMLWPDPAYTPRPTDGNTYVWVTVGHTQLRCGVALANGTGEGFWAVAPDGTRYRFDWLISRPYSTFTEPHESGGGSYLLQRDEVRIYATRVEDRFGNYVNYTYSGERLTRIESNDGRVITLAYNAANKVASVTAEASAPAPTRSWSYAYSGSNFLTGVTLPDGTAWALSTTPLIITYILDPAPNSPCNLPANFRSGSVIWTMTHPGGANAQFTFTPKRHTRTQVTDPCQVIEGIIEPGPARQFDTYSLVTKAIYGVGLTTATWSVTYGATANDQTVVTQTNPDSTKNRYTFGTRFYQDEGKLLKAETLTAASAVLRNTQTTYAINPSGQAYAYRVGSTLHAVEDAFGSTIVTTATNTSTTQDGATFMRSTPVASFDLFARPLSIARSSGLGFSKTELIVYHDNLTKWMLGQVASVTVGGMVQSQTEYYATTALPWREYAFGKLQSTLTYNADGTPATVANGANETITLGSWKRGLPQAIQYPDASSQSAVVDDLGWIRSITDERANQTSYGYDVMGRITAVTYPTGDTVAWLNPTIGYLKLTASELGVPAGSWRREEVLGTFRERTYYDARLRPVLVERMDTALAQAIYSRQAFDFDNRETFSSYPSATSGATAGINSTYDALGRLTKRQTTDATPIVIEQIAYLTGSKKQVTDADGKLTTLSFQAFDEPDYGRPTRIESHNQISITDIARDAFGKITSITQSGNYGGGTLGFSRSFTFDANQRPCRRIDPESGSTVWGYDSASRIAWEARGQTGSGCLGSAPAGATLFSYDLRGRPIATDHPGTADDVTRGYDAAGNLTNVTSAAATWTYTYNKRNLLESEQAQIDGKTLLLDPTYNAMGQVASLTTPAQTISYAPDALGRVRQLGSFITGIQYHPNGLPSAYSLGNGLTYTQSLNNRLWPQVQETKLGAALLQKYVYSYSSAGDLTFLDDQADGSDDATLGYDNLHRLTSATGLWGGYGYTYDPLHNIRSRTGPNALTYSYDAFNRLSGITGAQSRSYAYNARGEITGDGIKSFTLNADGQITNITGVASYAYDGNGKRIRSTPQGGTPEYALYSLGGDLLYTEKDATQTDYLKLAGQTLVELRKSGGVTTPVYLHPDLLGSPRKATNAAGAILWQEHFDPYGAKLNGVTEKIGYTGHAHDPESGYTYMQARFYDPLVGRFLSTDPIHFQDSNPFTFNRYAYANNNPFRYTDPTGMDACGTGTHIKGGSAINCRVAGSLQGANAKRGTGADEQRRKSIDNLAQTSKQANDRLGDTVSATEAVTGAAEMAGLGEDGVTVGKGVGKVLGPVSTALVGTTAALQAASGDTEGAKLTLVTEAYNKGISVTSGGIVSVFCSPACGVVVSGGTSLTLSTTGLDEELARRQLSPSISSGCATVQCMILRIVDPRAKPQ
ncbi:MAG: RHS repeat domain-containing protein [Gammaproteobacteria bacterium]